MCSNSCGSNKDHILDNLCTPPEVCANAEDSKAQHLLRHKTDDSANFFQKTITRDKPLLVAVLIMAVILHTPFLKFSLYPFMIFSTWVHEMCHGMMAIIVGGGIKQLYVYKDGSGLAYTWTTGEDWKRAVVASAGYTGTAVLGTFMLLWRRTRRGPTIGLISMGCAMLLSCIFFVRNLFGFVAVTLIGSVILLGGWKLPAKWVLYLYSFVAATCSFNALNSVNDLLDMQAGEAYVNGQSSETDAHTVADLWGMTSGFWAVVWLLFGLLMSAIGLLLPFDGVTYATEKKQQTKANGSVNLNQSLPQYHQPALPTATAIPIPSAPQEELPPAQNPEYRSWQTKDVISATVY